MKQGNDWKTVKKDLMKDWSLPQKLWYKVSLFFERIWWRIK